jgi:hypothetical protein
MRESGVWQREYVARVAGLNVILDRAIGGLCGRYRGSLLGRDCTRNAS